MEELRRRGCASEHAGAVEGPGGRPCEAVPAEVVGRHVVGVGPEPELGVIGEIATRERVAEVAAGGVARGRHRDAVEVGDRGAVRARDGELVDDPAIGELVVDDARVAVVVCLAESAEAGEERVDLRRSVENGAALVEHGERDVDRLHEMVRPDRAVGVRGRVLNGEGAGRSDKALADPLERGRHGGRRHADGGLDRRVGTAGRGVGETAERPLTPVAPRAFGLRRDRREARRHVVLRRRDDRHAVLFLRGRRTAKRERKRQRENEDDDCRGLTHPSHLTGSPLETPGGSVRSRVLLVSVRCPGRGAEPLHRYPVAAGRGTAAPMARAQHAAAGSHRLIKRTLACLRAAAVACAPRGSVVARQRARSRKT